MKNEMINTNKVKNMAVEYIVTKGYCAEESPRKFIDYLKNSEGNFELSEDQWHKINMWLDNFRRNPSVNNVRSVWNTEFISERDCKSLLFVIYLYLKSYYLSLHWKDTLKFNANSTCDKFLFEEGDEINIKLEEKVIPVRITFKSSSLSGCDSEEIYLCKVHDEFGKIFLIENPEENFTVSTRATVLKNRTDTSGSIRVKIKI